jgi:hypothetical protein
MVGMVEGIMNDDGNNNNKKAHCFSVVAGGSKNALPRGWEDTRLPFWGVSSSIQSVRNKVND